MDRVLALDARTSGWSAWVWFISGAALLFAALVILAVSASRLRALLALISAWPSRRNEGKAFAARIRAT
jgi:hypothetical protein